MQHGASASTERDSRGERAGQLRRVRDHRGPRPERARRGQRPGPGGRGRVRGHRPRPGRLPGQRGRGWASCWPSGTWAWPAPTSSCPTPTTTRWRRPCPTWTRCWPRSTRCGRTCRGRRRGPRWPTRAAGSAAAGPAGPPAQPSLGLDRDGWRAVRRGPGPGGRPLPRPRLRADLPPGDRDLRRGAVGDRGGARPLRHRAVPGDRAHDARRRRPGGACSGTGASASTTSTSRTPCARSWTGIVADGAPVTEIWSREAFCALGGGDLDVDAILDGLRGISFGGWLVVEQDILPRSAGTVRAGGRRSSGTTAPSSPHGGSDMPPSVPARADRGGPDGPHPPAGAGRLGRVAVTAIAEVSAPGPPPRWRRPARRCTRASRRCWTARRSTGS